MANVAYLVLVEFLCPPPPPRLGNPAVMGKYKTEFYFIKISLYLNVRSNLYRYTGQKLLQTKFKTNTFPGTGNRNVVMYGIVTSGLDRISCMPRY